MPIRLGCEIHLIKVYAACEVALGLSTCCVGGERRLEVACDITRVTSPRWLHVLWQMMLMIIKVVHEHLASLVCHLRRSRHIIDLAGV